MEPVPEQVPTAPHDSIHAARSGRGASQEAFVADCQLTECRELLMMAMPAVAIRP